MPAVPVFAPMLASNGPIVGRAQDHWCEPKCDGWRGSLSCHDGVASLRTRSGHPLVVPHLAELAATIGDVVLDGELVSSAGRGADFYDVARDLGRRGNPTRLQFAAFDILWVNGEVLIDRTYEQRRGILESMALQGHITIIPRWPGVDAEALLEACEANGAEGIVIKHAKSQYKPGARSRMWRKAKTASWLADHAHRRNEHAARRHRRTVTT